MHLETPSLIIVQSDWRDILLSKSRGQRMEVPSNGVSYSPSRVSSYSFFLFNCCVRASVIQQTCERRKNSLTFSAARMMTTHGFVCHEFEKSPNEWDEREKENRGRGSVLHEDPE
jgi:hypothetical protein